jgi:hypothetical protein
MVEVYLILYILVIITIGSKSAVRREVDDDVT